MEGDLRILTEVEFYQAYYTDSELWLAMKYCEGGSVKDIIQISNSVFHEDIIAVIMYNVLEGLFYLHSNGMIHRDIKADNILLDKHGNIQISDFGVSATLKNTVGCFDTFIGTPFWMSPEILCNESFFKI